MTGWHLCYTVRKLIRYCFKVREDNPNDLVSSCRNSSFRIGGFPRLGLLSPVKIRTQKFDLSDYRDKYVKNNGSCATDLWDERAAFKSQFRH